MKIILGQACGKHYAWPKLHFPGLAENHRRRADAGLHAPKARKREEQPRQRMAKELAHFVDHPKSSDAGSRFDQARVNSMEDFAEHGQDLIPREATDDS